MKLDVTKNAKRSIAIGFLNKIILMVLPFVIRSIINLTLGSEYLGLSSLFSSIIQVLSLTELGFSSAMVYHLYKPIAENNQDKINALLDLYKTAYRIIGVVVLVIGGIITFFLPFLVKGSYPEGINIYVLFLISVINTSISYFLFGYKQSLLVAYQREDINSIINLVVQLGMHACQIAILLVTHNYYLFVLCMPIFTVFNNLWIGFWTKKLFPNAKAEGKLDKDTLSEIKQLVIGTFIQRACGVTRNSLDSICVSAFLGLTLTGIYNNYYVIFNGVTTVLGIVGVSLSGGIGNHVALKSIDDNYEELKKLDFLYMNISGISTVCLLCLYQPFMKLWMGEKMLLPFGAVILMCSYFYILKMGDMKYLYNTANGLWWKLKWRAIIETIANIALNILLGKIWGVYGIIAATIISLLTINFIWGTTILFKEYFRKDKLFSYYWYHLRYLVVTALICVATYYITNVLISINGVFIDLMVKAILSIIISLFVYGIVYFKTNIFRQSIKMIRSK